MWSVLNYKREVKGDSLNCNQVGDVTKQKRLLSLLQKNNRWWNLSENEIITWEDVLRNKIKLLFLNQSEGLLPFLMLING